MHFFREAKIKEKLCQFCQIYEISGFEMYFSTERSRNTYVDVKFDGESIFDVYIKY